MARLLRYIVIIIYHTIVIVIWLFAVFGGKYTDYFQKKHCSNWFKLHMNVKYCGISCCFKVTSCFLEKGIGTVAESTKTDSAIIQMLISIYG